MYTIELANQQRAMRINRALLARVARATLSAEQVARAEIDLALVDDPLIHRINREFLNHDEPTDVISFLYESRPGKRVKARSAASRQRGGRSKRGTETRPRAAGRQIVGEIIISVDTALRCAKERGLAPRDELLLYLVHGLLHLCGFDDLSRKERKIMRLRERELLLPWNIVPRVDGRLV
jgi:probable rRNA maturation factor